MPSYTFQCQDCGEFTLFFKTMSGNKEKADCPQCQNESARVFFAPNLSSMSKPLKSQIEKGMEPRRMTRDELGKNSTPIRKKPSISRPWQMGS
ncbi:zinc ribbon domain-containing protein [Cytobacillus depressus]|uniref:Zinc ribbon domain-containing protein n=1 Tax=Cytobacillus depressus TaxID=1602942 RepID=A0A6L3V5Z0_9BACI|nr:zinc ribbon domain-containing protein [Cytobacillus depressus]KAB2336644.1 zinc ribbon domain-containing protein [Cytobacillus depressus]